MNNELRSIVEEEFNSHFDPDTNEPYGFKMDVVAKSHRVIDWLMRQLEGINEFEIVNYMD